jgi:hypothetical protein
LPELRGANRRLSKPSGGNGKISRVESHALDVEFPKQGNQQLALKNNREQMALEQAGQTLLREIRGCHAQPAGEWLRTRLAEVGGNKG